MARKDKGVWPWVLSLLAGALVWLGLSLVMMVRGTDGGGLWLGGGWSWMTIRVVAALLAAHVAYWWNFPEQGSASVAGFGALAGVLFFLVILDLRVVHPQRTSWLGGEGSNGQVAYQAAGEFQARPWTLPAGGRGGEGEERSAGLLESGAIPLGAVAAKMLQGRVPDGSQYLGAWLLLSYCLQGVFAGLLMRCLTLDPRLQMLGIGFFVVNPVLLNSVAYPATSAHWLLLAALWLYFRTVGAGRHGRAWLGWMLLGILSLWVQGQLALMVLLIAMAFVGRCVWLDRTIGFGRGVLEVLSLVVVMLIVGYGLGYAGWRSVVGDPTAVDAGLSASVNLAGPLDPAGWSSFLKPWLLPAGQSKVGFAYLGAGVMVLMFWCWQMIVARPLDPFGFRPWIPLVAVGVGLAVIAVMPRLAVGRYVLLDLTAIPWLGGDTGVFGASGRYLWPVLYAFLFLVIALIVHAQRPGRAVLLLGLALAIQVADLRLGYRTVREAYREAPVGLVVGAGAIAHSAESAGGAVVDPAEQIPNSVE